jgi:Calcineurin-like phosphoesterase
VLARCSAANLALLILIWTNAACPEAIQTGPGRIVAIGDIHGAGAGLVQILRAAGLIDDSRRWSGGTARLVQTGDMLDRGADVREVMDLLMRLEGEARRAGGRVDVLFGNHEGMNVLHDLRDVSAQAYATFADKRSEERRRKAFDTRAAIAKASGAPVNRDEWMASHPPGFVEYVEALGPTGQYGRWIRSKKVILQIGDTLFMHAGLHPDRVVTVDEVNRTVEQEVRGWDDLVQALDRQRLAAPFFTLQEVANAAQVEIGKIALAQKTGEALGDYVTREFVDRLQRLTTVDKWALVEADGPLWYRGLATLPDDSQPAIDLLLRRHGARRIVIGHTPQLPGRVRARFNGEVILIDTGMLSSYFKGGQPSAVEIQDGRVTAIYASGREPIAAASPRPTSFVARGAPPPLAHALRATAVGLAAASVRQRFDSSASSAFSSLTRSSKRLRDSAPTF